MPTENESHHMRCREVYFPPSVIPLMAEYFRAMAHPTRLRLMLRIAARESGVTELSDSFGIAEPVISRHLSVLRRAGIITRERAGNRAIHRIADGTASLVYEMMIAVSASQATPLPGVT